VLITSRSCQGTSALQDPSCQSYSQALLYFKGYQALQVYRFAHELWRQNRKAMAMLLQSRLSEVLAVDIHPAATIKHGILMDHGTGIVIGETAVVGNGVSMMQVRICCSASPRFASQLCT
jgi:serine O-acetyltransferase